MPADPRRPRRLEVEDIGESTIVRFIDRKILDYQKIRDIEEQLLSLVEVHGKRKVLLSFSNVEYLCSAAINSFYRLKRELAKKNGRLVLSSIDPQIYEIMEITKMDKDFHIVKEDLEGLGALDKPKKP